LQAPSRRVLLDRALSPLRFDRAADRRLVPCGWRSLAL